MKRAYIFGVGIIGIVVAFFFLSQGTSFDLGIFWSTLVSYFRRVSDKVNATVSSDPFTKAIDLIISFEGFSAKAYPDADGWSIGYGHFIRPDDPYNSSSVIGESEARTLLEQDVRTAQVCVANAVKVSLTANQTAALISFTYNVGCGAFQNSSLLGLLNSGDYEGAAQQFAVWNKSGGEVVQALVNRRAEEQGLFSS